MVSNATQRHLVRLTRMGRNDDGTIFVAWKKRLNLRNVDAHVTLLTIYELSGISLFHFLGRWTLLLSVQDMNDINGLRYHLILERQS